MTFSKVKLPSQFRLNFDADAILSEVHFRGGIAHLREHTRLTLPALGNEGQTKYLVELRSRKGWDVNRWICENVLDFLFDS